MSHSNKDCYFRGYGCVIMQFIVSSHAHCVIESRFLKTDCPKRRIQTRIFFLRTVPSHVHSFFIVFPRGLSIFFVPCQVTRIVSL